MPTQFNITLCGTTGRFSDCRSLGQHHLCFHNIDTGHFLGHDQTLNRMESDYFYPDLADRRTPQDWADSGSPDLLEQARVRTRELLAEPPPQHIPADIDAEIRLHFPIRLDPLR